METILSIIVIWVIISIPSSFIIGYLLSLTPKGVQELDYIQGQAFSAKQHLETS